MDKLIRILGLVALTFVIAGAAAAQISEDEVISSYHSRVVVNDDATLTVTETITVTAAGVHIRRGIYRDFPTDYVGSKGERVKVPFKVVSVRRDGQDEDYHTEDISGGVRVYMGRSNYYLPIGEHSYELVYKTDRQIGYFEGYDELYWNVTGNDWIFPIEKASVEVVLPKPASISRAVGVTGPFGTKMNSGPQTLSFKGGFKGNVATFETTRVLSAGEGLTVAIAFKKGVLPEPTSSDKLGYFVDDNLGMLLCLGVMVLVIIYYMYAWNKVGRDPQSGAIIPRFEPPVGYSPAAVRFVWKMGFDNKCFAAAVVNLAVKNYLTIEKTGRKSFTLHKVGKPNQNLSPGESKVGRKLLKGRQYIELEKTNHGVIGAALKQLKSSLKTDFAKENFSKNSGWIFPGVILSLIGLVLNTMGDATVDDLILGLFFTAWTAMWIGISLFMLFSGIRSRRSGMSGAGSTIVIVVLSIVFVGIAGVGVFFYGTVVGIANVVVMVVMVALNVIFIDLMKARTVTGQKIYEEIEGFRRYLGVAEQNRLDLMNPPEITPELFERFLPYAMALDVENRWGKQFERVVNATQATEPNYAYRPVWYNGSSLTALSAGAMAASLGAGFHSALSTSSSAPGSSSGSGGGGFSGGGGGGGGGGGW